MDARTRSSSYVAGNRVYEDVQPQYRWVPSEKEDTLVVDLTRFKNEADFKKEHLRIQIDNYGNLKVSGERPLGGVRWSRFHRVLHLPEDCDASGIRATFDDGILLVVMPKLVIRDVQTPPPAPTPHPAAATTLQPPAAKESTAKGAASSPTRQQSKLPAPVPADSAAATSSSVRRPPAEDRRSRGSTAVTDQQQKAEQVQGAPPAVDELYRRQGAAAADRKDEAEPAAPPPPVPEGKIKTSDPQQVGKTAGGVEEEKETAAIWSETGTARPRLVLGQSQVGTQSGRRPKQLLANVLVALLVLVGLGFYFVYRYNKGGQHGHQEEHHPAAPVKEE